MMKNPGETMSWFEDAVGCLKEYRDYAESMRAIGRGFHPTGNLGHNINDVIRACDEMLDRFEKEMAV